MKTSKLSVLFVIAVALTLTVAGCKPKIYDTNLGNGGAGRTGSGGGKDPDGGLTTKFGPGPGITDTKLNPGDLPDTDLTGRRQNRDVFQNETAYFEFDRSTVKSTEVSKIEAVAAKFKTFSAGHDLLIEGHCDERGTEEYNRSLGERRALALREYLINAGAPAARIHTKSFGKDKPAALGHDDSAWSKNRRGEFILVLPR